MLLLVYSVFGMAGIAVIGLMIMGEAYSDTMAKKNQPPVVNNNKPVSAPQSKEDEIDWEATLLDQDE